MSNNEYIFLMKAKFKELYNDEDADELIFDIASTLSRVARSLYPELSELEIEPVVQGEEDDEIH